jgi:hypothetical protein
MPLPTRWTKAGLVTTFVPAGRGWRTVNTPVLAWLRSAGPGLAPAPAATASPPQASQGGPSGGVTAVGPTGDGVPVYSGALLHCPYGAAPSRLLVTANRPANVDDGRALVNVMPFGMCCSLANPAVASATAAALGVLTSMPCTPATLRWDGGSSTERSGGVAALHPGSTLRCGWQGRITIVASA